jgi:S-formylglutathione hydrolase FrmB
VRRLLLAAATLLLVPLALVAPPAVASAPAFGSADGITVVDAHQVDGREWALDVSTAALGRAVRLRVLLPADYDSTTTRYPVLYLFHGTSGGPDDWFTAGDVEATTAGLNVIVVLPDAGFDNDGGGWFTNWWDTGTALGASQWETFHIDQLVPWVDANLRTIADRSGRAIAGLSQGGFGAFTYAARHPELFAMAGSFSGAPDIASDPVVESGATAVIEATATYLDGVEPAAMFGPHLTNELNWKGRDPATLVTNLRGMSLALYTATGIPGALDGPTPDPAASGVEFLTHMSTVDFALDADEAHVPYYLDDYVFGTHTFPYWAQDLRDFVPRMMAVFASPSTPSVVAYRSVDKAWTQWGWSVTNQRAATLAWSALSGATASGFTFSGTGGAVVTTPAVYVPGSTHAVAIHDLASTRTVTTTADAAGRLTFPLVLHSLVLPDGKATVTIS